MAGVKLFIIFLVVLVLDGLVLPAFFGLRNSFLSLLLLIVPILYMGPKRQYVACGLFFSVILEMSKGISLGGLALPFLFTSVAIYLTQRFLDIQYTYDARFGLGKSVLIALMSAVFIYVFSFFYKQGGVNMEYFDPVIGLTTVLEALVLVFVFNIVFNKKSDYARI